MTIRKECLYPGGDDDAECKRGDCRGIWATRLLHEVKDSNSIVAFSHGNTHFYRYIYQRKDSLNMHS